MSVVPAVLTRAELGQLGDQLAAQSGESVGIWRVRNGPASGLLFKEYKDTAVRNGRPEALAQLLALGRGEVPAHPGDREVLLNATSWPVARVTGGQGNLVGCLIPEADKKFRSDTGKLREIDTLAQTDARLAAQGLPVSLDQRLAVCREIAAVSAALERCGLVYSDWNYANALWCPADGSAFIIDVDGCRADKMPNICQSGWDDPLTAAGTPSDMYTDRFRVALLVARCLTGERNPVSVLHALASADDQHIPGRETLLDMLWAEDRGARPSPAILRAALGGVGVRFPVVRRPLPALPSRAAGTAQTPKIRPSKLTQTKVPPGGWTAEKTPPPPVAKRMSPALVAVLLALAVLVAVSIGIFVAVH
jgi:hypothetical protein